MEFGKYSGIPVSLLLFLLQAGETRLIFIYGKGFTVQMRQSREIQKNHIKTGEGSKFGTDIYDYRHNTHNHTSGGNRSSQLRADSKRGRPADTEA